MSQKLKKTTILLFLLLFLFALGNLNANAATARVKSESEKVFFVNYNNTFNFYKTISYKHGYHCYTTGSWGWYFFYPKYTTYYHYTTY